MKVFVAAIVLAAIACGAFAQGASPTPILPGSAKWQSPPAMPGVEAAWLVGSPDKPGIYAQRVRLAAGARIAPHTHPDERFSIVLEGAIHVGFGETFDETKVVAIPAGAMYVAPAGVAHYIWAREGPAVYQESGAGPTATHFIKRQGIN